MISLRVLALAGCLTGALLATPASAQDNRIGVYLRFTGNDTAGKQLAFQLREQLRRSGSFREAYSWEDSGFTLAFITLDPETSGSLTAYSYSVLLTNQEGLDYHVKSFAGYCGIQRIRECAADLLDNLGAELEDIRAAINAQPVNQGFR